MLSLLSSPTATLMQATLIKANNKKRHERVGGGRRR